MQDVDRVAVEDGNDEAGEVCGTYHRYEARADGEARADQNQNPLQLNHYWAGTVGTAGMEGSIIYSEATVELQDLLRRNWLLSETHLLSVHLCSMGKALESDSIVRRTIAR